MVGYPTICALAGIDSADDWADGNGTVHSIDGINLWDALTKNVSLPSSRAWLPVTENSIIWDDGTHLWKYIDQEKRSNRWVYGVNMTEYLDPSNPCLPGYNASTCLACSPSSPCLFDVRDSADPSEKSNVAAANPSVVTTMRAKLATYQPYVPVLSPETLACFDCTTTSQFGNYAGPCCIRRKID